MRRKDSASRLLPERSTPRTGWFAAARSAALGIAVLAGCAGLAVALSACQSNGLTGSQAGAPPRESQASVADLARSLGVGIGTPEDQARAKRLAAASAASGTGQRVEHPRNASALQAEEPAAAAMGGVGGIEGEFAGTAQPATQPSPDSWEVIWSSLGLFQHPPYVVDLILGFGLSLLMGLMLTAWPRSLAPRDPVEAADERNGAVIVALVGCLAAELVQSSERLSLGAEIALVLFGIGGLIRFRTVFGDPRRTGLMILITILGLCCGMSQYAVALLAFAVIWMVRYFFLSSVRLIIRVRVRRGGDPEQVRVAATGALAGHGATVEQSTVRKGGRTVQITARAKGSISETDIRLAIEDALPGCRVRVNAS